MANTGVRELAKKSTVLLLDVEGTTTSIRFIQDTLFPYVSSNVESFLKSSWEEPAVIEAVNDLRIEAIKDVKDGVEGAIHIPGANEEKTVQIRALVNSVEWQMSIDRKRSPLKNLQAQILKKGFESGEIKGHIYEDVADALKAWKMLSNQNQIYIYSSGAVLTQMLLFGHTIEGDLLYLFNGHFDTAVGGKQQAQSYQNIAESIGRKNEDILFLTDVIKEAEAAKEAGIVSVIVIREGNSSLTDDEKRDFPVTSSFFDLI